MTDKQAERRAQIEAAAFKVLENVGYKKASMLQIAKQAKASNETLYAWYGNKQSLFSSLVKANAQAVENKLQDAISGEANSDRPLVEIGKLLLQFTATEKAIIVNRAAVADVQDTGLLAQTIEANARQVMYRLLKALMTRLETTGYYYFDAGADAATETYINLLIGELQMQQSLGSISPLNSTEIESRAQRASDLFDRLFQKRDGTESSR